MTEQLEEPNSPLTVEELGDDWDADARELPTLLLPETLTRFDRCDRCGAEALHAWVVGAQVMLMCNHHGRENRDRLSEYPHRDYRMPVEEAQEIDAAGREAALAEANKSRPTSAVSNPIDRAGMAENDDYRPVPQHLTQWDAAWWA